MSSKTVAKRGPKTPEGKLAVKYNASTHGILSLQPVVTTFERAQDWEAHRQGIFDALSPEGGMEQLLAERIASCSWRLNRVLVFETESIAAAQEEVIETVRQERKHQLEVNRIFAKAGEEVLTDLGILMEAHPENALVDARMAREVNKGVDRVLEEGADVPIEGETGAWIVDIAAAQAVKMAARQDSGEEPDHEQVRILAEALQERLPGIPEEAYLGDVDWRAGQLLELIGWLAEEAGLEPEVESLDGSIVSPREQLLGKLELEVRYDLASKEGKAEEAQAQVLAARRERILPSGEELQKISRYESHLSRQMFASLHELEALQRRRSGREAPLARVDVQS